MAQAPVMRRPKKGETPTPPSIKKLLQIARRQSKQIEQVTDKTPPERKNTIGRKSLLGPVQAYRPQEIEPADEPAESSASRQGGSGPSTSVIGETIQVESYEELKELHARAVSAGPSAALRKDLSYEAHGKSNFKTEHGWFRSQDIEDLIKFLEFNEVVVLLSSYKRHYEVVSIIFILHAYGVSFTVGNTVIVVITATLAAIGSASIPNSAPVTMIMER